MEAFSIWPLMAPATYSDSILALAFKFLTQVSLRAGLTALRSDLAFWPAICFVNTNGGTLVQVNLTTFAQTVACDRRIARRFRNGGC